MIVTNCGLCISSLLKLIVTILGSLVSMHGVSELVGEDEALELSPFLHSELLLLRPLWVGSGELGDGGVEAIEERPALP